MVRDLFDAEKPGGNQHQQRNDEHVVNAAQRNCECDHKQINDQVQD